MSCLSHHSPGSSPSAEQNAYSILPPANTCRAKSLRSITRRSSLERREWKINEKVTQKLEKVASPEIIPHKHFGVRFPPRGKEEKSRARSANQSGNPIVKLFYANAWEHKLLHPCSPGTAQTFGLINSPRRGPLVRSFWTDDELSFLLSPSFIAFVSTLGIL